MIMDKIEIVNQEQKLQFEVFTHEMGLEIALRIIKKVKEQATKPVGIRIVHKDAGDLLLLDGWQRREHLVGPEGKDRIG